MLPTLLAMLIILALAAAVVGMVVVGMEGTARHRLPEVAHGLERAGKHLNGEAEPPQTLVALFEEAEEGASDLRQFPAHLLRSGPSARTARTAGSAASARSAASAQSVGSARSPLSAASVGSAPSSGSARSAVSAPQTEDAATPFSLGPDSAWESLEARSAWPGTPDAAASTAPAEGQPARNAWAVWTTEDRA